jgi:ribulose-phosphate 3-epimerase
LNGDKTNYWLFGEECLDRILRRSGWAVVERRIVRGETAQENLEGQRDMRGVYLLQSCFYRPDTILAEPLAGCYLVDEGPVRQSSGVASFRFEGPPAADSAKILPRFYPHPLHFQARDRVRQEIRPERSLRHTAGLAAPGEHEVRFHAKRHADRRRAGIECELRALDCIEGRGEDVRTLGVCVRAPPPQAVDFEMRHAARDGQAAGRCYPESGPMIEILPSILAADFTRLGEQIAQVEAGGASSLHLDVMDGHFVPNLTIGPPVVASIRKATKLTLDVHLMIEDPDRYAAPFIQAGADCVSVHQEVCPHLDRTLRYIQSEGARAGVVLNPSTPVSTLSEVLDVLDFVLIMSVNPGFGGQQFIPRSLEKISELRSLRSRYGLSFDIEIDGGVTRHNIGRIATAGANWLVAGTSVFGAADPAAAIVELKQAAEGALRPVA